MKKIGLVLLVLVFSALLVQLSMTQMKSYIPRAYDTAVDQDPCCVLSITISRIIDVSNVFIAGALSGIVGTVVCWLAGVRERRMRKKISTGEQVPEPVRKQTIFRGVVQKVFAGIAIVSISVFIGIYQASAQWSDKVSADPGNYTYACGCGMH